MPQPFKHVWAVFCIENIRLIHLKTNRSEPWNGVTCAQTAVLHVALLQVCLLPFAPCNEFSEHLVAFANDSYRSCKDTSQKSMCLDRSSNLTRECSAEGCAKSMCTHASMHPCIHPDIDTFTIWMEMRRRWKTSAQLSHVDLLESFGWWKFRKQVAQPQTDSRKQTKIHFCFFFVFSLACGYFRCREQFHTFALFNLPASPCVGA